MGTLNGEKFLMKFEYDFSKLGGATGALSLPQVAGNALNSSFRIVKAYVVVEETPTSGATPTVTIGNTTDPDGYFEDIWALLVAAPFGALSGQVPGDLINVKGTDIDHDIMYNPLVADDMNVLMTIGTAALTAGKFGVYLECLLSS